MIEYVAAKNPRYSSSDRSLIDVDVQFVAGGPFITYSCADHDAVSADLWDECIAGKFGSVVAYTPPALTADQIAVQINYAANMQIETGYHGRRLSLYGYLGQLNALTAAGTIADDQKADLQTLLDAAVWEQSVLDIAAAAISARTALDNITWPPAPPTLGALADLS